MQILVRALTIDDKTGIQEVANSSLKDLRKIYRPEPETIVHSLNPLAERSRLVALIDGQIIGTTEYVLKSPCVHVIGLGVLPEFRHRGVARHLLQHMEHIARQHSFSKLSLCTVCQTGNVPIFERLGFTVIKLYPDQRSESVTGEPLTEAYMEKVLV